jgi:hypothetical protein
LFEVLRDYDLLTDDVFYEALVNWPECPTLPAPGSLERPAGGLKPLVTLWKPMTWAEEQGQIKAGVGPFLDRRQRERQAYVHRQAFPTRGDKR